MNRTPYKSSQPSSDDLGWDAIDDRISDLLNRPTEHAEPPARVAARLRQALRAGTLWQPRPEREQVLSQLAARVVQCSALLSIALMVVVSLWTFQTSDQRPNLTLPNRTATSGQVVNGFAAHGADNGPVNCASVSVRRSGLLPDLSALHGPDCTAPAARNEFALSSGARLAQEPDPALGHAHRSGSLDAAAPDSTANLSVAMVSELRSQDAPNGSIGGDVDAMRRERAAQAQEDATVQAPMLPGRNFNADKQARVLDSL